MGNIGFSGIEFFGRAQCISKVIENILHAQKEFDSVKKVGDGAVEFGCDFLGLGDFGWFFDRPYWG